MTQVVYGKGVCCLSFVQRKLKNKLNSVLILAHFYSKPTLSVAFAMELTRLSLQSLISTSDNFRQSKFNFIWIILQVSAFNMGTGES